MLKISLLLFSLVFAVSGYSQTTASTLPKCLAELLNDGDGFVPTKIVAPLQFKMRGSTMTEIDDSGAVTIFRGNGNSKTPADSLNCSINRGKQNIYSEIARILKMRADYINGRATGERGSDIVIADEKFHDALVRCQGLSPDLDTQIQSLLKNSDPISKIESQGGRVP